ncbi:MAG TPA: glutamate 5-kinase [Mycobacteriales bacterium]
MSRVVVKVGSSSLTSAAGGLDPARLAGLVAAIAAVPDEVVLVSSGAIAAALSPLGLPRRPRDLATQQAAAAVGQLALVGAYAAAFAGYDRLVGQVLLTAADVQRRDHYRNARTTLTTLLRLGVVPIVNENDTVATDEIRFGDNDRLAALVAHLVDADRLVLLSDVDAVYDHDPGKPGAQRISVIHPGQDIDTRGGGTGLGRGGMAGKLEAARIAAASGVPVVIGAAADVGRLLADDPDLGSRMPATGPRGASRLRWLAHASAPRGRLVLDAGAVAAVLEKGASLLPAGITAVEGTFEPGDPVELVGPDAVPMARGIVGYASAALPALLGRTTRDTGLREVVHRDDLVPL